MSDKKERPRMDVGIEEVPEETFTDLLPGELERAEFIVGSMLGERHIKSRERHAITVAKNMAGVGFGDAERKQLVEEEAEMDDLKARMGQAREGGVNRWGHRLRPYPHVDIEHYGREDSAAYVEGEPKAPLQPLSPDPVCEAVKRDFAERPEEYLRFDEVMVAREPWLYRDLIEGFADAAIRNEEDDDERAE